MGFHPVAWRSTLKETPSPLSPSLGKGNYFTKGLRPFHSLWLQGYIPFTIFYAAAPPFPRFSRVWKKES